MIQLDGTPTKSRLGANAILGVSMAFAKASASSRRVPLYRHYRDLFGQPDAGDWLIPVPTMNILNGGAHADSTVDFQEFMVYPIGLPTFREALRAGAEVFHALRAILKKRHLSTGVGDEGGFAPSLPSNEQAVELVLEAIDKAGYKAGRDICIGLDVAASELWDDDAPRSTPWDAPTAEPGRYLFKKSGGAGRTSAEMIALYADWLSKYPIISIEDGLAEGDWNGWQAMTKDLGARVQIVGDDIFVTNPAIFTQGIERGIGNSILIKLNQIGTVSETLDAIAMAHRAGYTTVISPPVRRDRRLDHRRPRRGDQRGPDQDRLGEPHGSGREVQPVAAHRGGTGPCREVCRPLGAEAVAVTRDSRFGAVGDRGAFHLPAGKTSEGHPRTDGNVSGRTRSPIG